VPSNIPLRDVKRKPRKLGCKLRTTSSGYYRATRWVGGRLRVATFPTVKGRHVKPVYRRQLERQLAIRPDEWDAA